MKYIMKLPWALVVWNILLIGADASRVFVSGEIEKASTDEKEYRGLTLPNRLQVLLIRDVNNTKSAASLTIGVGSLSDPDDVLGLAHFLVHAIFLGSKKYPQENSFPMFLGLNGGSENGASHDDYTTFKFDVTPTAFPEALERFSQLFISPIFRESSLEKEINAVQSEGENAMHIDKDRIFRVEKETANKSHEYSRFTLGNRETLWTLPTSHGKNISVELHKFFHKYYSANIMRLAVLGPQTLDELQATVESAFSAIPDKNVELSVSNDPPYGPEELQQTIRIVAENDIRSLYFTVPVPYSLPARKTKPLEYVTSLLGHEGKGSVLSLLKEKNLATSLDTDSWEHRGFTAMRVKLDLTPEGLDRSEEVVCLLFRYIDLLKSAGPQEWYWKEIQTLDNIDFNFSALTEPKYLLSGYSARMLNFPLEEVVTGNLLKEYKPTLISDLLSFITPNRTRVTLVSKSFKETANITEKYWGIKYSTEKIDPSIIKKWEECKTVSELQLPKTNEFIPSKLELKERVEKPGIVPVILKESPLSRVWFLQDSEFSLPKAIVSLEIYSPLAYTDPLSVFLTHMMVKLFDEELNEFSYDARLAGLSYSLVSNPYGLKLEINGYNDKLGLLLAKALDTLTSLNFSHVDPHLFEAIKEAKIRILENHANDDPVETAVDFLSTLLRDHVWTHTDLISVAEEVTINSVAQYAQKFFSQLKLQWFFYGNMVPSEALQIAEENEKLFTVNVKTKPLLPSQIIRLKNVKVPEGTDWLHEMTTKTHPSNAVVLLYQLESLKNASVGLMSRFLDVIIQPLFFDTLRTQEQLGYIVGTSTRIFDTTRGFQFVIQGGHHPAYIYSRIKTFTNSFSKFVSNMTEETFQQYKKSFHAVFAKALPKTQYYRHYFCWDNIVSERLDFKAEIRQQNVLENLTLQGFQQFYNDYFGENGVYKRTILVNVLSLADGRAGQNLTEEDKKFASELQSSRRIITNDITAWKKQRSLYPIF